MKKLIFLLAFFSFLIINSAQNFNGRLSSSIYFFERYNSQNVSQLFARGFQTAYLNFNKDNYSLRTSINYENEFNKLETSNLPHFQFYNLYFEARKLFGLATVKFGRQQILNGVAGGVFDGIAVDFKYSDYKLTSYYGGNTPSYYQFKITDNLKEDNIYGGDFSATFLNDLTVGISYINKNFKPQEYFAARLDEALNPILILIRKNSTQYQLGSAKISYDLEKFFSANAKFEYDFNYKKTSKIEFAGEFIKIENLSLDVYYLNRKSKVAYNSIFSVFDYSNTQEYEFGAGYKLNDWLTISGKFANVKYTDEQSQRVSASAVSKYGTLSFRKTFGYAGELDAVSIFSGYSFCDGKISPSIGISLTKFKLSQDSDSQNLTSLMLGLNWRTLRDLSFDFQGHYLNSPIYKNDFRFLFKINYWFNTNLNLM